MRKQLSIVGRLRERHRVDSERMWPAPSDLDLEAAKRIEDLETIVSLATEGDR